MTDLFIIPIVWLFPVLFFSSGLTLESQAVGSKPHTGSQCLECSLQPSLVCPANTLKCILFLMNPIGQFLLFWGKISMHFLFEKSGDLLTVAHAPHVGRKPELSGSCLFRGAVVTCPREPLSLFFPGCHSVRVREFCHLVTVWGDPVLTESSHKSESKTERWRDTSFWWHRVSTFTHCLQPPSLPAICNWSVARMFNTIPDY